MSTRKRRKRMSLDSSSDDEEFNITTPEKEESSHCLNHTRSSERINKRRNRSFQMPSRDDLWSSIVPTKSPEKYYNLKPKKLVNNFTKENNSYNYDPNYTSGSESMDDFIDDDLSYRPKHVQKKKIVHRIKNRHTRVIQDSTDSDSSHCDGEINPENSSTNCAKSEENEPDNSHLDEGFGEETVPSEDVKLQNDIGETKNIAETKDCEVLKRASCELQKERAVAGDISEEEIEFKVKKKKTSMIETDTDDNANDDDEIDSENDSDIGRNLIKSKRRKSNIIDSEDDSVENGANQNTREEPTNKDNANKNSSEEPTNTDNANQNSSEEPSNTQEVEENEGNNEGIGRNSSEGNMNNQEAEQNDLHELDELNQESNDNFVVEIDTSDDDNDSFIVEDEDDDESDNFDDNDEPEDDDKLSTDDDDDDDSDSSDNTTSQRKNEVRASVVQMKRRKEELFGKFREARKRRTSRENRRNSND